MNSKQTPVKAFPLFGGAIFVFVAARLVATGTFYSTYYGHTSGPNVRIGGAILLVIGMIQVVRHSRRLYGKREVVQPLAVFLAVLALCTAIPFHVFLTRGTTPLALSLFQVATLVILGAMLQHRIKRGGQQSPARDSSKAADGLTGTREE